MVEMELIKNWGVVRLYRGVDEMNGQTIARYELEGKTYEIKDWLKREFINKRVRAFPYWDAEKRRWVFWSWRAERNVIESVEYKLKEKGIIRERRRREERREESRQEEHEDEREEDEEWMHEPIRSFSDLVEERGIDDWTIDYDIND